MAQVLSVDYFESTDVCGLAQQLIGKLLCTDLNGFICTGRIVETEAYRAPDDKACHAYGNKRTTRTATMFGPPGQAYVYLCYGIHHLFNVVTAPEDIAHAILIRAVEPVEGVDHMLQRRSLQTPIPRLTAGPGSLTKALGIEREHNGRGLAQKNGIWIASDGYAPADIIASPRVGVAYAEECAKWPWRYREAGSRWTSPAK